MEAARSAASFMDECVAVAVAEAEAVAVAVAVDVAVAVVANNFWGTAVCYNPLGK